MVQEEHAAVSATIVRRVSDAEAMRRKGMAWAAEGGGGGGVLFIACLGLG